MNKSGEDAELERLRRISNQSPAWLCVLWISLAVFLTLVTAVAGIRNVMLLVGGEGEASLGKTAISIISLIVSLLLLAAARDLWYLPKVLEGKARTWVL